METPTQTSIYQEMMNNRTLLITDAITPVLLSNVMSHLFYFDSISEEPIHIYISSPGGDVMSGLGIIDIMNEINSPVYTYAVGTVASMASIIFLYGEQRMMMPNSQIMIHQPLGGVQGQASDIVITANRILEMKNKLTKMVADQTGQSEKKVSSMMDRDTWLDYDKANELGFLTCSRDEHGEAA